MEIWTFWVTFFIIICNGDCDPCVDGNFDSITCGLNGRLYVTRDNNLYRGHCDRLPYSIDQEVDMLVSPSTRPVTILASVVDHHNTVYFFEKDQVIVMINSFTVSLPIGSVFTDFTDVVKWAVLIPSPKNLLNRILSDQILQIYTTSGLIYDYNRKDMVKGVPRWSQIELKWGANRKILPKNIRKEGTKTRTLTFKPPPFELLHIIGIRGSWIVALSRLNSNMVYGETSTENCQPLLYYWSLRNCILNKKKARVIITEDLFSCISPRHFLNIFTVFYWISIGLVCLGALLVLKFMIKSCPSCKRSGGEESESSSEVSNEENDDVEQPKLPKRTRRARRRSRSPRNRRVFRERSRELRYINFVNTVNQQFPVGTTNLINSKSPIAQNSIPITQAEQALLPPPIQPLQVPMDQTNPQATNDSQLQGIHESESHHQTEEYPTITSNGLHTHSDEINTNTASRNSTVTDVDLISPQSNEHFYSQLSVPKALKVSDVYLDSEVKNQGHHSMFLLETPL
ncbi:uncharacterized protein LOC141850938 isoform X2 [Brevipalpus obovatus]|uniref:uncharacterized protein LOC141850938 isoform X2 n=1 Tax=Brevipalpus obovatus TaxID=246614 RepID=UPI003D9F1902